MPEGRFMSKERLSRKTAGCTRPFSPWPSSSSPGRESDFCEIYAARKDPPA